MKKRLLMFLASIVVVVMVITACTNQTGPSNSKGVNVSFKANNISVPESTKAIQTWNGTITIVGTSNSFTLTDVMYRDANGNPAWDGIVPLGTYDVTVNLSIDYDQGYTYTFQGTQTGFQVTSGGATSTISIPVNQTSGSGQVISGIVQYFETSVTIIDASNSQVIGATVTFNIVDINNNPIQVVTAATTKVQLPKGTWNFTVTHPGYVDSTGQVTIVDTGDANKLSHNMGTNPDVVAPTISGVPATATFQGNLSELDPTKIDSPIGDWTIDFSVTDNVGLQSITTNIGSITDLGGGSYRLVLPTPTITNLWDNPTVHNVTITATDLIGNASDASVQITYNGI